MKKDEKRYKVRIEIIHEHGDRSVPRQYHVSISEQYFHLDHVVDHNPHKPTCLPHIQELNQRMTTQVKVTFKKIVLSMIQASPYRKIKMP